MLNLDYLKEFLMIADFLSFSKTASELFISQSTLSRHIASLEESLGVQLLSRSTTHVSLTKEGLIAKESFHKIVGEFEKLQQSIAESREPISRSLRIGVLYYTVEEFFGDALHAFSRDNPNVNMKFLSGRPENLRKALLNDEIDLCPMIKAEFPNSDQLIYHHAMTDRFIALLPARHPLASRNELFLSELQNERFIFLKDDEADNELSRRKMAKCGFYPEYTDVTESIDSVCITIQATGGVHITGQCLKKLQNNFVTAVPIADRQMNYDIVMAYKYSNTNTSIQQFLKYI